MLAGQVSSGADGEQACTLPGEPFEHPRRVAWIVDYDLSGMVAGCWAHGRDRSRLQRALERGLEGGANAVGLPIMEGDVLVVMSSGLEGKACGAPSAEDRCSFVDLARTHGAPIALKAGGQLDDRSAMASALSSLSAEMGEFWTDRYSLGALEFVDLAAMLEVSDVLPAGEAGFTDVVVVQLADDQRNPGGRGFAQVENRRGQLLGLGALRGDAEADERRMGAEWMRGRLSLFEELFTRAGLQQGAPARFSIPGVCGSLVPAATRYTFAPALALTAPSWRERIGRTAAGLEAQFEVTLDAPSTKDAPWRPAQPPTYAVGGVDGWRTLVSEEPICVAGAEPPALHVGLGAMLALPGPKVLLSAGAPSGSLSVDQPGWKTFFSSMATTPPLLGEPVALCEGCDAMELAREVEQPLLTPHQAAAAVELQKWRSGDHGLSWLARGLVGSGLLLLAWVFADRRWPAPLVLEQDVADPVHVRMKGVTEATRIVAGSLRVVVDLRSIGIHWHLNQAVGVRPLPLRVWRVEGLGPIELGEGMEGPEDASERVLLVGESYPLVLRPFVLALGSRTTLERAFRHTWRSSVGLVALGSSLWPEQRAEGAVALVLDVEPADGTLPEVVITTPASPLEHRPGATPARPDVLVRIEATNPDRCPLPWAGTLVATLTRTDEALSFQARLVPHPLGGVEGVANRLDVDRPLAVGQRLEWGLDVDFGQVPPPRAGTTEEYRLAIHRIEHEGRDRRELGSGLVRVVADSRPARLRLEAKVAEPWGTPPRYPGTEPDSTWLVDLGQISIPVGAGGRRGLDREIVLFQFEARSEGSHGGQVGFALRADYALTLLDSPGGTESASVAQEWAECVTRGGHAIHAVRVSPSPTSRTGSYAEPLKQPARVTVSLLTKEILELPLCEQRVAFTLPFVYQDSARQGQQEGRLVLTMTLLRYANGRSVGVDIGTSAVAAACAEVGGTSLLPLDLGVVERLRENGTSSEEIQLNWESQPEGGRVRERENRTLSLDRPRSLVWSAIHLEDGKVRWPALWRSDILSSSKTGKVLPTPKNLFYRAGTELEPGLQVNQVLGDFVGRVIDQVRRAVGRDPVNGDLLEDAATRERDFVDRGTVVVTHPTTYGPRELALLEELVRARLPRARVLMQPESDAVAWFIRGEHADLLRAGSRVLIYDAGAGTLDLTYLEVEEGGGFRLVYRAGLIGCGTLLTERLARLVDQQLLELARDTPSAYPYPLVRRKDAPRRLPRQHPNTVRAVWRAIEDWKTSLSSRSLLLPGGDAAQVYRGQAVEREQVNVRAGANNAWEFCFKGGAFEERLGSYVSALGTQAIQELREALRQADLGPLNVDLLVLSGRASRLPALAEVVQVEAFHEHRGRTFSLDPGRNEDKGAVALGAAALGTRTDARRERKESALFGGVGVLAQSGGGWAWYPLAVFGSASGPDPRRVRVPIQGLQGPWLVWDPLLVLFRAHDPSTGALDGFSPRIRASYRRIQALGDLRAPGLQALDVQLSVVDGRLRFEVVTVMAHGHSQKSVYHPTTPYAPDLPDDQDDPLKQWPMDPTLLPESEDAPY